MEDIKNVLEHLLYNIRILHGSYVLIFYSVYDITGMKRDIMAKVSSSKESDLS